MLGHFNVPTILMKLTGLLYMSKPLNTSGIEKRKYK